MLASAPFARAVAALRALTPRPEIALEEIPAPQRLAPYTFALGASVLRGEAEVASGRLVLLFNPAGEPSWGGALRIVSYVTAEVEPDIAADPSFPSVAWSWLIDSLSAYDAQYTAEAGTVTRISSTRFGDGFVADDFGERHTTDVELRASWTALDEEITPHGLAWCRLLAAIAGLPPPGVTLLR